MSEIPSVKKLTQQDYKYLIEGIKHHDDVVQELQRKLDIACTITDGKDACISLIADLERQNADLQENNTKLVLENRELKNQLSVRLGYSNEDAIRYILHKNDVFNPEFFTVILKSKVRYFEDRIATLEKSNPGYVNLEKYVQDWLVKLGGGETPCFEDAFHLIKTKMATLEKQLERKVHDC